MAGPEVDVMVPFSSRATCLYVTGSEFDRIAWVGLNAHVHRAVQYTQADRQEALQAFSSYSNRTY